ncbi:ATP-dependent zinc protease family protein [Zunongwangia sp. HGR-M22]|uniref:ATP-dependent zinc protease family protein n=1 Tax=Zunongwangia sp. HGR-M22 TaxID=3015168 RepID=UPI0022DE9215|nr:RimK/LysX family protein [Zunongwangia sp. HGR-M22]WBL25548.1 RimK/LysX family protein [Zunongwangia sp. HGR-M22]
MGENKKTIIGRFDKADFPILDLEQISVKIDTGAYTSSIHCDEIIEKDEVLHCKFLDDEHESYNGKEFTFKDYEIIYVRSSNGIIQKRYQIESKIKLFNKVYKISLSLSSRQEMRFPVLLGRKFLSNKFIVDPQLIDLSFNQQHQNDEH